MWNLAIPFFLPVWRRVAVVSVAATWALVEYTAGAPVWALIFLALGFYAVWQFQTADWDAVAAAAEAEAEAAADQAEPTDAPNSSDLRDSEADK